MSSATLLLIGANGQLGHALLPRLHAWQQQNTGQDIQVVALNRQQLDLSHPHLIRAAIRRIKPSLIINAAAYTAVDQAEAEPEIAYRINAAAPAVMAEEAKRYGAALIHYSTDYVFDGSKNTPYAEADIPNPINAYGRSKLAGDQAIQTAGIPHLILRTGWVYGWYGHNFLRTILRLSHSQRELHVVDDQWGTPTWSSNLADVTSRLIAQSCRPAHLKSMHLSEHWWQDFGGLYHCASRGQTNWYTFARQILADQAWSAAHPEPALHPLTTAEAARPAPRPAYSVMACNKFGSVFQPLPEWRAALQACLAIAPVDLPANRRLQ